MGAKEFILAVVIAALSIVPTRGAQNLTRAANTPKWEAGSIRPCGTDSLGMGQRGEAPGPPFTFTPERMTLRWVNVKSLIQSAYKTYFEDPNLPFPGRDGVLLGGVPQKMRIDGGPDWINSERYTIEAKAERAVEYAMNDLGRQRYADITGRPVSEIPSSPSIFTALQEQLGLRLEATKAPVEHLVIDRIERPSPN